MADFLAFETLILNLQNLSPEDRQVVNEAKNAVCKRVVDAMINVEAHEEEEDAFTIAGGTLQHLLDGPHLNGGTLDAVNATDPWRHLVNACGNMKRSMTPVIERGSDGITSSQTEWILDFFPPDDVEGAWWKQILVRIMGKGFNDGLKLLRGTKFVLEVTIEDRIMSAGAEQILFSALLGFCRSGLGTQEHHRLQNGLLVLCDI